MPKDYFKNAYYLWPFRGCGYFLTQPKLWFFPLIAMIILTSVLVGIFIFVMLVMWPNIDVRLWFKIWDILKAIGLGSVAVLIGFIILMPAVITVVFDKMIRKIFLKKGRKTVNVNFFLSLYSSSLVFFKTLFWRIIWPIAALICALFLGPIGSFISQVGIGHLAVIDGVDLSLALLGYKGKERILLYKQKKGQIFVVGFFAGILSMCLSITVIGWIIWVPSIFAASALWVLDWKETQKK